MEGVMEISGGVRDEKLRARRFLEQVRYLDRRVEALLDRAERSRARLGRVTALYGQGDGQDCAEIMRAVREDDRRLNEEIDRLVDAKAQVLRALRELGDAEMAALMEMRYLNGMGWQQIALRMHVDKRTATRIHAKALERLRVPEGFGG